MNTFARFAGIGGVTFEPSIFDPVFERWLEECVFLLHLRFLFLSKPPQCNIYNKFGGSYIT